MDNLSAFDEWKTQLTMKRNFMSPSNSGEKLSMHSKSEKR